MSNKPRALHRCRLAGDVTLHNQVVDMRRVSGNVTVVDARLNQLLN